FPTTLKFGAFCPTFISGPTRVIGFPRIVTAPLRSSAMSQISLLIDGNLNLETLAAPEVLVNPRSRAAGFEVSLRIVAPSRTKREADVRAQNYPLTSTM